MVMAAMDLPSGDGRGEKKFSLPGKMVISFVARSKIEIVPSMSAGNKLAWPDAEAGSLRVKTIDLPSGVQPGSKPTGAPGMSSRRSPPFAETTKARKLVFSLRPMNTICLPSGDQRGSSAYRDEELSCIGELPSIRLRQSVKSGIETYATHWPSGEKARSMADAPPEYETHPDLGSKRSSSARGCHPTMKIFLPSLAGTGKPNWRGPLVSCTGSGSGLNQCNFSGSTQRLFLPRLEFWKM